MEEKVFYFIKKGNPDFNFDFSFIKEHLGIEVSKQSILFPFIKKVIDECNMFIKEQYRLYLSDLDDMEECKLKKELVKYLHNGSRVYCNCIWTSEDDYKDDKVGKIAFDLWNNYEDEEIKLIIDE